jgi:hypothetical protein
MADALDPVVLPPTTPQRRVHYGRRGAIILGALVVVFAGVILGFIALLDTDREGPWSPGFKTTVDDPVDRGVQVADYVQKRYLAAPGTPLAIIKTGEDVIPDLPFHDQVVALSDDTQTTYSFEQRSLLFYKLCPTRESCELPAAADRQALGPLYARQAIELALFGFRYVPEAAGVVVELPTGYVPAEQGKAPDRFVHYFPRKNWEHELDIPFAKTLPGNPPLLGTMSAAETNRVSDLATDTFYKMDVGTTEDQSFIVYRMTPPAPS